MCVTGSAREAAVLSGGPCINTHERALCVPSEGPWHARVRGLFQFHRVSLCYISPFCDLSRDGCESVNGEAPACQPPTRSPSPHRVRMAVAEVQMRAAGGPCARRGMLDAGARSRHDVVGTHRSKERLSAAAQRCRAGLVVVSLKGQVSALSEKPNSGSFSRLRLTQARSQAARGTRSLAQPPAWGGPRRPCPRPGGVDRVRATI